MIDLSKLEQIKTEQDLTDSISLSRARAYLKETDWHAFALLEEGTQIPEEIRAARAEARATILMLTSASI
ncbi:MULTISPECIES: hypothetical protein [unclassified Pseudomonas]|uniref:hypothetical protein n=1 Tax=unclassified Pseudomonas TaxID=196821 RepID=UPI000CD1C031|nr:MULTISPECIES: hypothetical protein [unclassified Pseudomonas]POA52141.1 hypothetical protein C1889_24410 [Pseudomonas sp. FW507-12TSA]